MDEGLAAACSVDGAGRHRLRLSARLRTALSCRSDDGDLPVRLVALARHHAAEAQSASTPLIDDLRSLAGDLLIHDPGNRPLALALLAACALHHAMTGKPALLADEIDTIVAQAARTTDPSSRFRAQRIVFASALARGDLQASCRAAESAWRAAQSTGAVACRFESLLLVVLLLETMGLSRHARDLSLDLVRWRAADASLDTLHLANAAIGLRISHQLEDLASAALFHTTMRDAYESGLYRDALSLAVTAASMSRQLLWTGKPRPAARLIDATLAHPSVRHSPRASTILRTAEVDICIAIGDPAANARLRAALEALLPQFQAHSPIHQHLLRATFRLDLGIAHEHRSATFARYRDRSEPAILSLPVDFFWWSATADDAWSSKTAVEIDDETTSARFRSAVDPGFTIDDFIGAATVQSAAEDEATRRSPHYDIVEGWAVAAEMAAGGDGRQCFKVGRVAATLAAALGFSDARCVMLDMACRLRDFGRSVVDCTAGDDGSCIDARHLQAERIKAAERMLSFSSDPVLVLARLVATQHRAWWNGSGVPGTLTGADIPIEARICAVADALVDMVDPMEGARRWSIDHAMRQIRCLAGVRFDPRLVDLLADVLRHDGAHRDDTAWGGRVGRAPSSMAKAKKGLFESLELVDESVVASN